MSIDTFNFATQGQLSNNTYTFSTMGYSYKIEIIPITPTINKGFIGGKQEEEEGIAKLNKDFKVIITIYIDNKEIKKEYSVSSNEEPKAYDFKVLYENKISLQVLNPKIKFIVPHVKVTF
jgi:hypothetical protein